jgi:hypothetical protein
MGKMEFADDLMNVVSSYENRHLTLEITREIAAREQLRWYVAPILQGWTVGKMPVYAPLERHPLMNIHREPVVFSSVERALQFLRDEFQIYSVAVMQS